jgi:hypothetical protein
MAKRKTTAPTDQPASSSPAPAAPTEGAAEIPPAAAAAEIPPAAGAAELPPAAATGPAPTELPPAAAAAAAALEIPPAAGDAELPPAAATGPAPEGRRPGMQEIEARIKAEREAAREAERNGAALDVQRLEQTLADLGQPREEWKAQYQAPHLAKVEEKRKTVQRLEREEVELRDRARGAWDTQYAPRELEKGNVERELDAARRKLAALS